MALTKLSAASLSELKELYKVDWPLHVGSYNLLKVYAKRFTENPKWKEKVKFWTLNDNWRQHGSFVMTFGFMINLNSLEISPCHEIKKILLLLEYKKFTRFYDMREVFTPVVREVMKERGLTIYGEAAMRLFFTPKEFYKGFGLTITPPDGFTLKPLRREHATLIDALWPHRNELSLEYIQHMIEHNVNSGLFNENDELVSWTLSFDHGETGFTQTLDSYQGKHLSVYTIGATNLRNIEENDFDVYGSVMKGNIITETMMIKKTSSVIDERRAIKVLNDKAIVLKNHL